MAEERNMVNLTLTVTREERKALKQLALDKDTTVSALLREWLKEHLEQELSLRHIQNLFIREAEYKYKLKDKNFDEKMNDLFEIWKFLLDVDDVEIEPDIFDDI